MSHFSKYYKKNKLNLTLTVFLIIHNFCSYRSKSNSGLWLGLLMGTCALITFMKEDSSYSEISLLTGLTGLGLIMSCICLIFQLYIDTSSKDFQLLYFLPASLTSMLYLLWANKGIYYSYSMISINFKN